jgi:DNA repair protein RadC
VLRALAMTLKALPFDARPREKLLSRGAGALADAELLAIVLRTGLAGLGELQHAQNLLDQFGGLRGLLQADGEALRGVKGLGPAKRAELLAVLELAQRAAAQGLAERSVFDQPQTLLRYAQLQYGGAPAEAFSVLFLDLKQRLIAAETLFHGTLNVASVYPREIVLRALQQHAASVVLVHNHPSGNLKPSDADRAITRSVEAALATLDIRLADHLIVGPQAALSMASEGGW